MRKIIIICFIFCFIQVGYTQKNNFLRMASTTPLLDFPSSNEDCSGLLYWDKSSVFIITARHNLFSYNETLETYQLKYNSFTLVKYSVTIDNTLKRSKAEINLAGLNKINKVKFLVDRDIAAIEISKTLNNNDYYNNYVKIIEGGGIKNGSQTFWMPKNIAKFSDVIEGNDIYLVGYPRAIGLKIKPQFDTNRPLFRKGIVAGINMSNKTFIIDAASFDGNSGGPVIQLNLNSQQFEVIGFVIQKIPISPNGRYVGNSGYSVVEPISSLERLLAKFK